MAEQANERTNRMPASNDNRHVVGRRDFASSDSARRAQRAWAVKIWEDRDPEYAERDHAEWIADQYEADRGC